mmetsp:Transcript_16822/g.50236  ORF Transcript_16822/g.50236 Transcript_16822/m.50236 type:complete len:222 (-) Transcript_16822:83-748(-)
MSTMADAPAQPAWPVIHGSRRKRMTPRMFWRQGRKTPLKVPSFTSPGASTARSSFSRVASFFSSSLAAPAWRCTSKRSVRRRSIKAARLLDSGSRRGRPCSSDWSMSVSTSSPLPDVERPFVGLCWGWAKGGSGGSMDGARARAGGRSCERLRSTLSVAVEADRSRDGRRDVDIFARRVRVGWRASGSSARPSLGARAAFLCNRCGCSAGSKRRRFGPRLR